MFKTAIRVEQEDVDAALARLGLTVKPFIHAVRSGYLSRIARTANDAPAAAGFYQWNDTLRGVRDELVLLGWTRVDEQGFSTVVSSDGKIAIAVSSGDEATGVARSFPRTKRDKGPRTADAVNTNAAQLDLFPETLSEPTVSGDCLTYVLLFHADRKELRAELSLPVSLDDQDHISSWRERIILPSQPIDPEGAIMPEPDFSPEIDISVQRRA